MAKLKKKNEKFVVLNTTVSVELRKFAEELVAQGEFSSISDYIRSLIKQDKDKKDNGELKEINKLIFSYLNNTSNSKIPQINEFSDLSNKLQTIAELFHTGYKLKENKLKRSNPRINSKKHKQDIKKWIYDSQNKVVPGLIEESVERKKRLLSE